MQLYTSRFGGPDAKWDVFKCWDGELPELATAAQYKAIFITGSHYSAYEDLPWIDRLVAWLHDFVIGAQHDTKIVAVCFGSQVIARGLGGRIGKNTSGRFALTVEELCLEPGLKEKTYFKEALRQAAPKSEPCSDLKVLESHGDQVLELPRGAELLATSATAPNEIWTYQDRVLAIQGHPEMPSEDALQKIWPFLSSNGRLSEEEAAASKHALQNFQPDSATIQSIMAAFIAPGAEQAPPPGGEQAGSSYTSWLPSMTLPNMPSMPSMPRPGMSLPSVPMPSMGLPSLSLPDWLPRGPYASSPAVPEQASSAGQTSTALRDSGGDGSSLQQQDSATEPWPAAPGTDSAEVSMAAEPSLLANESTSSQRSSQELPVSQHATGGRSDTPRNETAASSWGTPNENKAAEESQSGSSQQPADITGAKAEDFLGTLSRAVIAELDGSLADVQLLFGVNTVARAEFQRILQELVHWSPLVEDMKRKQKECIPMLAALDTLEARMVSMESAIASLDQQTRKLSERA